MIDLGTLRIFSAHAGILISPQPPKVLGLSLIRVGGPRALLDVIEQDTGKIMANYAWILQTRGGYHGVSS